MWPEHARSLRVHDNYRGEGRAIANERLLARPFARARALQPDAGARCAQLVCYLAASITLITVIVA